MDQKRDANDVLLLARLGEWLGVKCDRATAIRYLDAARREHPSAEDVGAAAFALAGSKIGLRISPLSADLDSALERASRETPLVARAQGREGESWALVLDRRGRRVFTLLDPWDQPRWIPRAELAEHLRLPSESSTTDWLIVHAAAPYSVTRPADEGIPATPPEPLERLLALLKPDRQDIWAVLIFAVAIGGLLLATPIAVQAMVNFVAFGGAVAPVLVLAGMLAVGLLLAAGISALQAWIVEMLQRRIFVRMVADLAHRLPRVHRETQERAYGPELVNRFFDVITVQKISSLLLLDGVAMILGVLVGLVFLAFYHPILLAFDLLLVLCVIAIVFVLGRSGIRSAIRESKTKYAVAAWLEDIARDPVTFKKPDARSWVLHRSDELARDYVSARRDHYRVLFRQILAMLGLQVVASVSLLSIGGVLVIRGELTLGQLVAAELIVTYVVSSIAKMGKHFESFYDLMAAVDKLGQLLDLRLERTSGEAWAESSALDSRGCRVELRDVDLRTSTGRDLFDDLSLSVRPGERVVLRGPNGSGKSVLLEILYGTIDPEDGQVEIDGLDVRSIRLEGLRNRVALVNNHEVFAGTIYDNLLMGRSLPVEEVQETLRRLGLLESFAALPDGIQTRLTANGAPLSQSQLQRLAIARAIVGQPRLLLVDGMLEGLGYQSLERVLEVLTDPTAPWTLLVVSHRPEVAMRCTREFDLGDTMIAERSAVR